jgi:signal transduction histidine kinase
MPEIDPPTSHPQQNASFRLHPLTAEFTDRATERAFRQATRAGQEGDFRIAIGVGAFFYLTFGLLDFAALGATRAFWFLLSARLLVTGSGLAVMALAGRATNMVTSGYGATVLEVLAVAANLIVITTRPADLAAHASAMMVILMAIYVFVPNRFLLALAAAMLGTLTFVVYLIGWAQVDKTTTFSLLAVLLLINTFGLAAAYRFSRLRRREYTALEAERQTNEALLNEIARRKSLETELTTEKNVAERARDQAEAASRAKSRFLAAASHDLRQPMHALSLFAATLVERLRYPEVRQIADQMQASIISLTSLFDSLLDISRLDAGTVQTRVVSFRLQDMFDSVRRDFGARANSKGIRLIVVPTRAIVRSDPILLERILRNLAANAVHYTEHGGVVVGCRRRGGKLQIQVWDSGSGIPEGEQKRIFEEFYQIANPERDRSKGLGLGLAIVKRLADLLGHPLGMRSQEARGSVFSITVPRGVLRPSSPLETAEPMADTLVHSAQRLVVLIEDERVIREATRTLLTDWGCRVIASASTDGVIDEMRGTGETPDLIIADYRLTGGDTGINAIHEIQRACARQVPAVLITGDVAADHLKLAQASGYPVLHKPVAPAKLRALIASIQPRAPEAAQ